MKRWMIAFPVGMLLAACSGNSTVTPPPMTALDTDGSAAPTATEAITLTAEPTTAKIETPTTPEPDSVPPSILIRAAGDQPDLLLIDPASGQAAPFASPDIEVVGGFNRSDAVQGKVYVITGGENVPQTIAEITPGGVRTLTFGENINALAVLPIADAPDHSLVAFGVQEGNTARLMIAAVDGADAILVTEQTTPEGFFFEPVRWSADGQHLYYTEEPTEVVGYGGLLGGFTSLYVYYVSSNESTVILPQDVIGQSHCLDDLSPDERLLANHCADGGIGIVNLEAGREDVVIEPPADMGDWTIAGSTRFSPDSTRIAFAVVRGDPNNEQGWVLVTDDLSGASRLVATAAEGDYFMVEAWLDSNTLILQSGLTPAVWLLRLDGSEPVKLSDGYFLDIMR